MDENFDKDNLEEFFRKSFDELEHQPSEDWDTPSGKVWQGVEAGLSAKGILLNLNWVKLAAAAAAILLIVSTALLFNKNRQLSKQLVEHTDTIEQLQEELTHQTELVQTQNDQRVSEDVEAVEKGIADAAIAPSLNKQLTKEGANRSYNTIEIEEYTLSDNKTAPSKFLNDSVNDETIAANTVPEFADTKLIDTDSTLNQESEQIASQFEPVPMIERLTLNPEKQAELENLAAFIHPIDPSELKKAKFKHQSYARIYASANYTGRSTIFRMPPPFFPRNSYIDRAAFSSELGLVLGTKIAKKWSIESGISFYKITHKSKLELPVDFNPNLEMPDPDNMMEQQSIYALSIPSVYGEGEVDIALNRSMGQGLDPGEVPVDYKSKKEISFTSIPIVVAYHLGNKRLNVKLKGGIVTNFLDDAMIRPKFTTRTNEVRASVKRVNKDLNPVKKVSLDYIVGVGVNYYIDQSMSINIEPTYRRNLNPLVETNRFSTKSYALGLQTGLSVHF